MKNQIQDEFKKLKKDFAPRSEWVALNRTFLLRQIMTDTQATAQPLQLRDYLQMVTGVFKHQIFEPAVVMLLVLATFMGSSLTINAAFYSLPGDNLYPMKLTLERTHLALISDGEKRVELQIEFAQNRVAEFDKIVSEPTAPDVKKKKIEAVVKEFKNNVASVGGELQKINDGDDQKVQDQKVRIAITITAKADELAKSFGGKVENLDAAAQLDVEQLVAEAVATVQETGASAQKLVTEAAEAAIDATGTVQTDTVTTGVVEGVATEGEASLSTVTDGTGDSESNDTQEPVTGNEDDSVVAPE